MHAPIAGDDRGGVPQAVLLVEHDGGKAFARDGLGDDRRGERAPGRNRRSRRRAGGGRARRRASRQPLCLDLRDACRPAISFMVRADSAARMRDALGVEVLAHLAATRRRRRLPRNRPSRLPWRRRRRRAPVRPSFSAAHRPSSLLRRAHRLELQLLVMRELLFEAFLALVECGHAALVACVTIDRVRTYSRCALHIAVQASRQHRGACITAHCDVENVRLARLCCPDRSARLPAWPDRCVASEVAPVRSRRRGSR